MPRVTLKELIETYKKSDRPNYGSPGAGTMPHLAAELFRIRSGLTTRMCLSRRRSSLLASPPTLADTIAGHV
jgi:hypothetical protein